MGSGEARCAWICCVGFPVGRVDKIAGDMTAMGRNSIRRRSAAPRRARSLVLLAATLLLAPANAQLPESAPVAASSAGAPAQERSSAEALASSQAPQVGRAAETNAQDRPVAAPTAQQSTPVGDAPPGPGVPAGPSTTPPLSPLPAYESRYRGPSEATLWCDALERAAPERVRRFDLATARDGRVTPALEIAAPGPIPPAQRPTVIVVGALDGRSLAGAEAALATARALAEPMFALPAGICVIVTPFANVEALDLCAKFGVSDGRTSRPVDDDRDGASDEDGPDDIDDDGRVLEMLIEAPDGAWMLSEDGRWALPAHTGPGMRFERVREGRDDDGDGRFNEDGPGGVDLDRNFPIGREGPWADPSVGALPLSEPVSRALADLARGRRCFAVLLFQGRHGALAAPGGSEALERWAQADHDLYDLLGRAWSRLCKRDFGGVRSLRAARGEIASGAALDWFAASCGALALELAPWGPQVDLAPGIAAQPARFDASAPAALTDARRGPDQAWERWLDERGGVGYVRWRPIELPGGRRALVGGFEAWTVDNPPSEVLPRALAGAPEFVAELCAQAPQLAFEGARLERSAGVVRVRASVRNRGGLPTGLRAPSASSSAEPLRVRLELPDGARLLAGTASVRLDVLSGGALSRELEWIVLAPAPAALKLIARGGWCSDVVQELAE